MTSDELAHEIARWAIQSRNTPRKAQEWERHHEVTHAYRERMAVEDYLAHQFGQPWPVHSHYADHTDPFPTGEFEAVGYRQSYERDLAEFRADDRE